MKSKKTVMAIGMTIALSAAFTCGAFADTALKKITAYQNSNISVKVDGKKLNLVDGGDSLAPIVYEGHSYVPAKALAEALGASVKWDGPTTSVLVTSGSAVDPNAGLPTKDNSTGSSTGSTGSTSNSGSTGTSTNPSVKNTFDLSITEAQLFAAMQPAAKQGMLLYLDAIKTGNMTKLNAFIDSYFAGEYESDVKYDKEYVAEKVNGYREANKQDMIDGVTAAAVNALNNIGFDKDYSQTYSYDDGDFKSKSVEYVLTEQDNSNYSVYFVIKFSFHNIDGQMKLDDFYFY